MAEIPQYRSRRPLPVPEAPRIPMGSPVGEALERGGAQIANAGFTLGRELEDARRVSEVSSLKVQAATELQDLYDKTVTSSEFQTAPEDTGQAFQKSVSDIKERIGSGIKNPQVKAHFDNFYATHSLSMIGQVRAKARTNRIDISRGQYLTNRDALIDAAVRTDDDVELSNLVKAGLEDVDAHARAGIFNASDAPKMRKDLIGRIGRGKLDKAIFNDPEGAYRDLMQGKYDTIMPDDAMKQHFIERAQWRADRNAARAEALERKAEAERNRQARNLARKSDDWLASIADTGEGGYDLPGQLRAIGTDDSLRAADELDAKQKAARLSYKFTLANAEKPFTEQMKAVETAFSYEPGQEGARELIQARDMAARAVQKRYEAFLKDPANYAGQVVPRQEGESAEDFISRSLALQTELGAGSPFFEPRILAADQAKNFVSSKWNKMDSTTKMSILRGMDKEYGKYKGKVLDELGLGAAVTFADFADAADPKNATFSHTLLEMATVKEADIPGDVKVKNETKRKASEALQGSDVWKAITGKFKYQPQNSIGMEYIKNLETGLINTAIATGDVGKTMDMLDRTYNAVTDDDLGYLIYPKNTGLSSGQFEGRLRDAKEKVAEFIAWQTPPEGNKMAQALYREKVKDLKGSGSVWVNSPDGDGFTLLDKTTGKAITGKDGKPYSISLSELLIRKDDVEPRKLDLLNFSPVPQRFEGDLSSAAGKYGLDKSFLASVIKAESAWNPNAVSSRGARGLMQLMPGTASDLGVSDPFDPGQNIDGGARYLSSLLKRFGGDKRKALVAYNWGPENAARWNGDIKKLPMETRDYIKKVLG